MWAYVLRRHWLLATITGVCGIVNTGLVLEIVSAVHLGKPFDQIVRNLSLGFIVAGPSLLALSVLQGAYVFLRKTSVDPVEACCIRVFRVLSIVNSTIPIVFGAFAFSVVSYGYF